MNGASQSIETYMFHETVIIIIMYWEMVDSPGCQFGNIVVDQQERFLWSVGVKV